MVSTTTWKKLQAGSGLVFGVYIVLHFASHYSVLKGWDKGNATLREMRSIYQTPLFEAVLLLSFIVHSVSNFTLYNKRLKAQGTTKKDGNKKDPAGTLELKAHRLAGYIMGLSLFGHVFATRIATKWWMPDPAMYDYRYIKLFNDMVPFNIFMFYLLVFACAGNWHLVFGVRSAIATLRDKSIVGKPFPMVLKVVALSMHLLMFNALAAIAGYYYVVEIDEDTKADFTNLKSAMFMSSGE